MKKLILFCLPMAASVLAGCATIKSYSDSEFRTLEPKQCIHITPVAADLQVNETRITYAERINVDIRTMSAIEAEDFISKQKEAVLFRACEQHKADVLVAPLTDVQSDANGNVVIKVVGYPATYKNFRNFTKEDAQFIPCEVRKDECEKQNSIKLFPKK